MSTCKECIYYDMCGRESEYFIICLLDYVNFDDGNKDDIGLFRKDEV